MRNLQSTIAALLVSIAVNSSVSADMVVPFTEDFASSASGWRDSPGILEVAWTATGGPDGGAFASTTFNFAQSTPNATPLLFRAQDEFDSSNGVFVGNWFTAGIDDFSAFVIHDAPSSLYFFARFTGPANTPGAVKVFMIPVAPNTWTQLDLTLPDAGMTFEGPFTHSQVFSNIGHVQVGVSAQGVAGLDQTIHFGLDKVSIVPEPATLLLLGGGALVVLRRASIRKGQYR